MSDDRLMEPLDIFGSEQPGGEQAGAPAAPLPAASLALDELDDDNPDWLTGPRPKPTPMLLTLHKPGTRGADALGHVGALPRGKVALLVSPGGVGKTALLCQLALSVATGRPWLDTFSVRGGAARVVLALGEEDRDEIRLRLWDAAEALGLRSDAEMVKRVRANLRVMPLYGQDAKLLASNEGEAGRVGSSTAAPSEMARSWMKEFEAGGDLALIIFDPLSRFIAGDENDNTNATNHITVLEQFTKLPGNPTVLCAHHTNKGALNDDKKSSQADARGASGLVDGPRWVAVLAKRPALDGQARATFSLQKTNYTAPLDSIDLIRDGGLWRCCSPSEQGDLNKQPGGEQPAQRPTKNKETSAAPRGVALVPPGEMP